MLTVHFMVSPCYGKFFLSLKHVFLIVTLKRYKLTGDIDKLSDAVKQYSKFLRQLQCGGDLYPGQGPVCQYNATHVGSCSPDCIRGLEESGEYCGCSGGKGQTCPNSPAHIRCCLDTCSQELKMDLGFVLDASGSVGALNYALQLNFTKDLLSRVNVGENKTHVGIINYSTRYQILTWLNTDYDLSKKLQQVDRATYLNQLTDTALALEQANNVFSYQHGLREVEEGATPVLFVITDGASDNRQATIAAAAVLKDKGIQIVSVGVGKGPNLDELHAICTPPVSDNYFAM
jgi:collagen type VI alpha